MNGTNPAVREKSAELFSKMMSDKLIGPKVKILLLKFLPAIFMDAMRDSSEASVHMFEGKQNGLPCCVCVGGKYLLLLLLSKSMSFSTHALVQINDYP